MQIFTFAKRLKALHGFQFLFLLSNGKTIHEIAHIFQNYDVVDDQHKIWVWFGYCAILLNKEWILLFFLWKRSKKLGIRSCALAKMMFFLFLFKLHISYILLYQFILQVFLFKYFSWNLLFYLFHTMNIC